MHRLVIRGSAISVSECALIKEVGLDGPTSIDRFGQAASGGIDDGCVAVLQGHDLGSHHRRRSAGMMSATRPVPLRPSLMAATRARAGSRMASGHPRGEGGEIDIPLEERRVALIELGLHFSMTRLHASSFTQ